MNLVNELKQLLESALKVSFTKNNTGISVDELKIVARRLSAEQQYELEKIAAKSNPYDATGVNKARSASPLSFDEDEEKNYHHEFVKNGPFGGRYYRFGNKNGWNRTELWIPSQGTEIDPHKDKKGKLWELASNVLVTITKKHVRDARRQGKS